MGGFGFFRCCGLPGVSTRVCRWPLCLPPSISLGVQRCGDGLRNKNTLRKAGLRRVSSGALMSRLERRFFSRDRSRQLEQHLDLVGYRRSIDIADGIGFRANLGDHGSVIGYGG